MRLSRFQRYIICVSCLLGAVNYVFWTFLILLGALYGGDGWLVRVYFNMVKEGPLEIVMFPVLSAVSFWASWLVVKDHRRG